MIQWVVCDPATGVPLDSLPGLRLESSLPCYVGRGDTINVSIPIMGKNGRNLPLCWLDSTDPNRAVLVAHYDDDAQTVLWAGPITYRSYGSGPLVKLSAQSVDGWLATQQTSEVDAPYSVVDRDQCLILADFLAVAALAFHGRVDVFTSGITQSAMVADTEDKTCSTTIATLMGLTDGPEYRIGWEWDADGALVMVATVAQRIGTTLPAVLLSGVEWERTDDYSAGKGATKVTATATNSGAIRNQSSVQADDLLAAGYLPVEYRYTPDTGETSIELLASAAAAKLAAIKRGTTGISLTFHPDGPYRINRDIQVGDVFEADLDNPDLPEVRASLTARMLGFVAEADRVSGEIVKITPVIEEVA